MIKLEKWDMSRKEELAFICNNINRKYLSDRIPNPYTVEDAKWWLENMAIPETSGIFRAIIYDGKCVGNIAVEIMEGEYRIGYFLLTEYKNRGIMTEATRQICQLVKPILKIESIGSVVYSPNVASLIVLLKNGFLIKEVVENYFEKDGEFYDKIVLQKNFNE